LTRQAPAFSDVDRERLMSLGQDLLRAWESPGTTSETRKKILRTVISEIVVDIVGTIGDGRSLAGRRPHPFDGEEKSHWQTRWATDATLSISYAPCRQIPMRRSRPAEPFGKRPVWNSDSRRICSLRKQYGIEYTGMASAPKWRSHSEEAAATWPEPEHPPAYH